jgi:endonuclease I
MKHLYITFISCLIFTLSFGQMPAYYNGIDFSQPATTVEANLKTLITNTHSPLDYSDTYPWVKLADEDESNTFNVVLMYNSQSESKNNTIGGGNTTQPEVWNREHVYPQSLINAPADADLHHLRACDGVINNNRGNLAFKAGSGSYGQTSGGWYPGDEWKGDVARMIMYVYLRYGEPFGDIGTQSLFVEWNAEDPVSNIERQRNDIIYGAQGNRNPFIDQPYLATYFWGGTPAEDTWGWPNTVEERALHNIVIYPNPISSNGTIQLENITTNITGVYLSDITGRVVQIWNGSEFKNSSSTIRISSMDSGNYFLTLQSDFTEVTKKIIVE